MGSPSVAFRLSSAPQRVCWELGFVSFFFFQMCSKVPNVLKKKKLKKCNWLLKFKRESGEITLLKVFNKKRHTAGTAHCSLLALIWSWKTSILKTILHFSRYQSERSAEVPNCTFEKIYEGERLTDSGYTRVYMALSVLLWNLKDLFCYLWPNLLYF